MNNPVVYVDIYITERRARSKDDTRAGEQKWRWRAINAGNNRKMATSGEAYHNYADCLAAVQELFGPDTVVYKREAEQGNVLLRHPEEWPAA